MIIDSHTHIWRAWPYDCAVPDPGRRGGATRLLGAMTANDVDHAIVVCARIGGGHGGNGFENADNNEFVQSAALGSHGKLLPWLDVDSWWTRDYHAAGAADRLRRTIEGTGVTGFTHYLTEENDGWLDSDEARAFFSVAADSGLIASLSVSEPWLPALRRVAASHPELLVLLHHLGLPGRDHAGKYVLDEIERCADVPNIGVKLSGLNHNSLEQYPYFDSLLLVERLAERFGPERLYWGSDAPVSSMSMPYRDTLALIRDHAVFFGAWERAAVMGGNLRRELEIRGWARPA